MLAVKWLLAALGLGAAQQPPPRPPPTQAWAPTGCADRTSVYVWDTAAPCAQTTVSATAPVDADAAAVDALLGQTTPTITVELRRTRRATSTARRRTTAPARTAGCIRSA